MNIAGYYYITPAFKVFFINESSTTLKELKESPIVMHFWPIDPDNKTSAINFLIEARSLGIPSVKVKELLIKWKISHQDLTDYLNLLHLKTKIKLDGMLLVENKNEIGLKGTGANTLLALVNLCSISGFTPDKNNPTSFEILAVPTNG